VRVDEPFGAERGIRQGEQLIAGEGVPSSRPAAVYNLA
jgi:hypothetical protein